MPTLNTILVRYDGGYIEAIDDDSVTASGRHETLLSVADMRTPDEALRVAASTLDGYARIRTAVDAGIEPVDNEEIPYIGFDVGDTVTIPNAIDVPTTTRVQAISVSEDTEGNVTWAPELGDIIDDPGARTDRWLRRMDGGTLSGRSESAQPLQVPITRRLTAPPQGGKPYATLIVAASDSYAPGHLDVDYVCGPSDASVMLNIAIDNISDTLGGRILLLEGTYPLLNELTLDRANLTIEGQGPSTHLRCDANNIYMIRSGSGDQHIVKNLRLDGSDASGHVGIGYLNTNSVGHVVENVIVHNTGAGIAAGPDFAYDGMDILVNGCWFYDNPVYAIRSVSAAGLRVINTRISGDTDIGVWLDNPGTSDAAAWALIANCSFEDCGSYSIYCRERNVQIIGNRFTGFVDSPT